MGKYPCRGCVYYKVCGESTRTVPCYGRMTKRERGKTMRIIDADVLTEELSSLTTRITGLQAGKGVLREFMTEYRKSVLRVVDEQPTIDAVPVVHGRWIKGKKEKLYCDWEMNGWYDIPVRCSSCKYDATEYGTGETRFCPDCGAKMDGGK